MTSLRWPARLLVAVLIVLGALAPHAVAVDAQNLEPIVYTVRFPQPASKTFTVDVTVPTGKRDSLEMMMAIWSPGFYGIQNYADRVTAFSATAPDGVVLDVEKPNASRWTIK